MYKVGDEVAYIDGGRLIITEVSWVESEEVLHLANDHITHEAYVISSPIAKIKELLLQFKYQGSLKGDLTTVPAELFDEFTDEVLSLLEGKE